MVVERDLGGGLEPDGDIVHLIFDISCLVNGAIQKMKVLQFLGKANERPSS